MTQKEFEDALQHMTEAAEDARHGHKNQAKLTHADLNKLSGYALLASMPPLSSRRRVQLCIAAIALGRARNWLYAEQVKEWMYTCQLGLQAFGTATDGGEPQKARSETGFTG